MHPPGREAHGHLHAHVALAARGPDRRLRSMTGEFKSTTLTVPEPNTM
jgi:hypothetical protein